MAIPVWYVAERRMQLLLPFYSANSADVSCFLVDRDDKMKSYCLKTIFDLDQAYFSAVLPSRVAGLTMNPASTGSERKQKASAPGIRFFWAAGGQSTPPNRQR